PDEILIIDGSIDDRTKDLFQPNNFNNLKYYKVSPEDRGLTRQRNFGINKVSPLSVMVAFLDDDTILHRDYFFEIIKSYQLLPNALAISGYITNETNWRKVEEDYSPIKGEYF